MSKLYCPFRAAHLPHTVANDLLHRWLSRPDVNASWKRMISGRQLYCDCGDSSCHLEVVRSTLDSFGDPLPDRFEWRRFLRELLRHCQLSSDVSDAVIKAIQSGTGGISELSRFLQAPFPDDSFCPQMVAGQCDGSDLLPLPLPDIIVVDRQWARSHARQAKHRRKQAALSRWSWLSTLGSDYLFAGMDALLFPASTVHTVVGNEHAQAAVQAAQGIVLQASERMIRTSSTLDQARLQSALRGSRVSYAGSIIDHAHYITAAQVAPGLPAVGTGGKVPLVHYVDTKEFPWILDPSKALKDPCHWPHPVPRARVMVKDGHWEELVTLLFTRGLIAPIEDEQIFAVDNNKVLNGMFGVLKPGKAATPHGPVLRLIMNFTPVNSFLMEVLGEVATLPRAGQWATLILADDETLVSYGEDQSASFYLYSLPKSWRPFMVFSRKAPGALVGRPDLPEVHVASTVMPMGWLLALPDLRGDRPFPLECPWHAREWQEIYLDNWDACTVYPAALAEHMAGTPSQAQLLLRSSWESAGVVRNESKAVEGHIVTTNKGALFEGSHGTIGPSPDRLAELGFILLTLCASDEVSQEQLQIALGHVAHCATFRRPLFSCLSAAYRAASEWRSGPLEPIVVDELLTVCSLLAYTFIDAKARLDPQVVCTDASETGGGACLSVGLTPEARDYWLNQLPAQSPQVTQTTTPAPQPATAPRVFLLSLFDGIGGALQALKLLGVSPVAAVIVEPDSFARRVVHQHHNVWQQFSDVADLTDVIIQQWGSSYADVVDVAL
eukprot:6492630-Amphidinium_carterae.2